MVYCMEFRTWYAMPSSSSLPHVYLLFIYSENWYVTSLDLLKTAHNNKTKHIKTIKPVIPIKTQLNQSKSIKNTNKKQ